MIASDNLDHFCSIWNVMQHPNWAQEFADVCKTVSMSYDTEWH